MKLVDLTPEQQAYLASKQRTDKPDELYSLSEYVSYPNWERSVVLDGDFTTDQLEAIVAFMRDCEART